MDQNKKRLSILKKAVRYETSPTQTFTKSNRRISFSGTKSVKEFIPVEDNGTIWGTSYEEEDGNQGSGMSNQDNSTVETSTSFTNKFGMTLRNRKIIQTKIPIEDKENIATEITMDTQIFANSADCQSFNSTLDVTLNSFEMNKYIKTTHDGITTKTGTSSSGKQLAADADISKSVYCSFISEEDRKMILQNRVAKKNENAIDNPGNNDSSDFLKKIDKLTFEDPQKRHILVDKNQADSINMSLSISPIISTDLSKAENNSNTRKTIIFQHGQMIASVEPENQVENVNSTRIRRTALLNEDLILDAPIIPRKNVDKVKVNIKEPLISKEDEMVIDEVKENPSMERNLSGDNSKRKTIIFEGDDTLRFETDQQKSTEVEREIQSNPPTRKTIIFPRGEKLQACVDEGNTGKTLQIQKPRQTIIFDSSEKLDDDFQSQPYMAASPKRKTHGFGGVDMEIEQNFFMESAQSQIKIDQANIEEKNRDQLNAPCRKTILFPKGEKLEPCSDEGQTGNNETPLHLIPGKILIHDKGENVEIFSNISDVDMEIDESSLVKSPPKMESKIQSNSPSRKTIIFPTKERLKSRVDEVQTSDPKSINHKSRQTMIFDNGEKIDDDLNSMQSLPINAKRITQLLESLDIEVEPNSIVKAAQEPLNEDKLCSFNTSESLGGQNISLSGFNKMQGNRQSVLITNDCLEETLIEPYPCTEQKNCSQYLESDKNRQTLTYEPKRFGIDEMSFELPSNKALSNNDYSANRKTIDKEDEIVQTQPSHCRNLLTKENKKDNPYVSFPMDEKNLLDIYASGNHEEIFDLKRNFDDGMLDFKQNDARQTTLFQSGEPMKGIIEAVRPSHVATIEHRIRKNEARKTLIFQHGEPVESCEVEVYSNEISDKTCESALNIKKCERRKTKIFDETEFLDMTENESLNASDYVSQTKASQNREILDQSENKRWKDLSTAHDNKPQETKHVSGAELSFNEIVPAISFVSKIDARKTQIFQHGEVVEEINEKSFQQLSNHSKDIRKTTLFHKDLEESGLAFLEPDNSSRPPSRQMITSCDDEMEIDYLPSSQQQQNLQKTSDSIRKTIIFSQAINMNNDSCQENTNQSTKSSNHTASVGVLNFGTQQGFTDSKQNIQPNKMESIKENASEKLDNVSKQVMNAEAFFDKANYQNPQRKSFVFDDEDMEIEIDVVLNKKKLDRNIFNQDALSKETANRSSSSKTLFSAKSVEVNQLKSDIRNESEEMQTSQTIYQSILQNDSHNNNFKKKIQAQSLETREVSDIWKTLGTSKIEHHFSNSTKGAIPKVNLSSNQEYDLSFDSSVAPDHMRVHVNNEPQRKTIFFQGSEYVDLNESVQNQKRMMQNQGSGNNILNDSKNRTTFGKSSNRKTIIQADEDIIVDGMPSSHHVVKDNNKRRTMIFPKGEDIEEESEIFKDHSRNDTLFTTNEAHLSEYVFPTKRKENSPQPTKSTQTSFINNKTNENSSREKMNNEEHMRTENNPHKELCIATRKTVIIENSPSKQVYLSQSNTELVETRTNNSKHANISYFHITENGKDMELDQQVTSIEKDSTETSSRYNKNRKTIYLNEDIDAAIDTSFFSTCTNKNNILHGTDQFSLARNESKKNVTQSSSTFVLPHEIVNQRNSNTQNESIDQFDKCSLSSRPKNRETYTIHNETNKSQNEMFAANRETFIVSKNKETCDSDKSSTRKTFDKNSSTTSDINPRLLHNLPQDSIYFSRTANFAMAGMESFQVTGSSFNYSPNSTAALCNLDPDQITGAGYKRTHKKNSASENTCYKQIKRDYAEITIDTIRESPDQYSVIELDINEDIDKTHIELVDTIDTIEDSPEKVDACEASVMILNSTVAKESKGNVQSINIAQQQKNLCRKCKNCQKTIFSETTLNETTLSDFNQVENEADVELDFSALDRLKGKPNFRQVWNELQEQRLSGCFNTTYEEPLLSPTVPSMKFLLINSEEEFLQSLNEETLSDELTGAVCPTDIPLWFLFENRLQEKSSWDCYDLNLPIGILECRHRHVKGIRLLFRFDAKDLYSPDASDFYFKKVSLDRCNGYRNPSPIEKAVQDEILLRIPRELTGFCSTGSELFTYLAELEETFTKSRQLVHNLLKDTYSNDAFFECDESDNCIIRKTVFNDTRPEYGYKIEFRIRIRNIEKLCAKDILLPPQSFFKDKIRTLPTGLEFVKSFLNNPVQYLK